MVNALFKKILIGVFLLGAGPGLELPSASAKIQTVKKSQKNRRRRDSGQSAVVIIDGSAVYEAPNFDAPVMEYLDRGKKVRISQKVYPGIGGLGTFYKIRLKTRVYGYITDVDLEISGKAGVEVTQEQLQQDVDDPTRIRPDLEDDSEPASFGESIYLTRFFGVSFSNINYKETIARKEKSSQESLFGLKMSGPGEWLGGMPLDLELQVMTSPPSFYDDDFATATGYMLMAHAYAMFPLVDEKKYVLYYEFGPLLKYTLFDVKTDSNSAFAGKSVDSQEITLGLGLGLGGAVRLGERWSLRGEGVYIYEAESYFGFAAALQMRY